MTFLPSQILAKRFSQEPTYVACHVENPSADSREAFASKDFTLQIQRPS